MSDSPIKFYKHQDDRWPVKRSLDMAIDREIYRDGPDRGDLAGILARLIERLKLSDEDVLAILGPKWTEDTER